MVAASHDNDDNNGDDDENDINDLHIPTPTLTPTFCRRLRRFLDTKRLPLKTYSIILQLLIQTLHDKPFTSIRLTGLQLWMRRRKKLLTYLLVILSSILS